ncbi:MAG: methyltransferase domain-containing protein [Planctomycetota bacterium]|nr:MAG: methyltransferase domain-containing protein [Planctomycetota bacterium]
MPEPSAHQGGEETPKIRRTRLRGGKPNPAGPTPKPRSGAIRASKGPGLRKGKPYSSHAPGRRDGGGARGLRFRLPVLYEDDRVVAVEKPSGMELRGKPGEMSVVEAVRRQLRVRRADRGPWTIHQVETNATGVCVLARTPAARDELLKSRRTERFYLALCEGAPAELDAPANGTISSEKKGRNPGEMHQLVTHYQRLGVLDGRALLRLRPRTDGQGQIAAHLRQLGAQPVYGPRGRLGLHLAEVVFTHPQTHERVRVHSPAPAWMYEQAGVEVPASAIAEQTAEESGWDRVADWYAEYVASARSDLIDELVRPGVQRLLAVRPGETVLDVACGEGTLARDLAHAGARVIGIDASERLIARAREMALPDVQFRVADARRLEQLDDLGPVDAASCVLALMNIDPIEPVLQGVARLLGPDGRVVLVLLHPAFRSPGRTSWGWHGREAASQRQYRRVDAYLSRESVDIVMNPGQVAAGAEPITTTTYVRPIEHYVSAMTRAGLVIDALEEWASPRRSEPGPRAREEDRARREIPMFLALRGRRAVTDSPAE